MDIIEALINRFPEMPPSWVHQAVDSVLSVDDLMAEV